MASTQTKAGSCIYDLDTPATLIDLDRLENNIADWQGHADRCGVGLRPHIKTHKIPEIARMQMAAGARGIVSAKVSEAEPFAAAGIEDICIAYPVVGETKWQRTAALAARIRTLTVNCDSAEAARGLSKAAVAAGVTIQLQIDIDSGLHRGGIPREDDEAIGEIGRRNTSAARFATRGDYDISFEHISRRARVAVDAGQCRRTLGFGDRKSLAGRRRRDQRDYSW